jgi:hypothetical protein
MYTMNLVYILRKKLMKAYKVTIETGIKSTTIGVQPEVLEYDYVLYADDLDEAMTIAYKTVERLRRKEPDRFYTIAGITEI